MSGTELDPDGTDSYHPQHPWEQTSHPLYVYPSARTSGNWPPVDADPAGPHEASAWAALPRGRRGHIEPTVPVPVSLIEQAERLLRSGYFYGAADALAALLTQPTPTAEPCCSRPGDPNWHTAKGDHVVPPDVEEDTPTAALPRVVRTDYAYWPVIDPSTIRDVQIPKEHP